MSERVYKLLNGSELLVSEEVMGVRHTLDGIPITVDGDYVIDDVLTLVDQLLVELEEERKHSVAVRKAMQDVLYYLQRDSLIPAQDILEQYLALGQEVGHE